MRVLVTGPDGVLGSNLVRELLTRHYEVSVFLLKETKAQTLNGLAINRLYGNVLNPSDLDLCFQNQDVVIHCAAATNVFPARNASVNRVNIEGTQNVIDAALKHKIQRLIYVGTANSFGFGETLDNLGKEFSPYKSSKYGLDYMDSKMHAQEMILNAVKLRQLPALVVNPTFMIGPYDSKPSSGIMVMALHKGKIPGYTAGGKNYIAVKDAAVAIANSLTMGKIGECYILGNENLSYQEAFEKISKAIGVNPPKRKLNTFMVIAYGRINSFFATVFKYYPSVTKELAIISCDSHFYSAEKAKNELALPQTPIEVAAKECFDWFVSNGYIK